MTKILVIRFSSIGDIVLTSPILRCIKTQLEGVELHYLTKPEYVNLIDSSPYVDKVHAWSDKNPEVLSQLKREQFNYIIDLHKNLRSLKVKLSLKKKSFSFPKLNLQKWLYVNFKWNFLPEIHIVDRYFKAVKSLGVVNDKAGLDFFINIDEEEFKKHFNFIEGYIVVVLGAKFATKKMPPEKLSEVLKDLPLPIILIGGSNDREEGERIKGLLPEQIINNTCGGFSIHQSAQVIKNAILLITHDTGMMHIGAAFHLPIVSIWGNTVPEFGMYPYRPKHPDSFSIHEVKGLYCRPCSKIGFQQCPEGHFRCMMDQDTHEIKKQVNNFLDSFLKFH